MGILDDAIRQHLDLKRRQGAEDDEIQRLEDEAFGPPTRPGEPDFPETGEGAGRSPRRPARRRRRRAEAPAEAEAPSQTFFDHAADGARAPAADAAAERGAARRGAVRDGRPRGSPRGPRRAGDLRRARGGDEPPIESLDTVEHPFEDAVEDTGEAEVVAGRAGRADARARPTSTRPTDEGEEDVLEETPEFLRDQPEDDELWFEQGEPKDFDF